jgi:hypothetical protein
VHIQGRIPPRRTEAAGRRSRPAPLSPPPEWRFQHLFVEPPFRSTGEDDEDDVGSPAPTEPPAFRPRRRPYRT